MRRLVNYIVTNPTSNNQTNRQGTMFGGTKSFKWRNMMKNQIDGKLSYKERKEEAKKIIIKEIRKKFFKNKSKFTKLSTEDAKHYILTNLVQPPNNLWYSISNHLLIAETLNNMNLKKTIAIASSRGFLIKKKKTPTPTRKKTLTPTFSIL